MLADRPCRTLTPAQAPWSWRSCLRSDRQCSRFCRRSLSGSQGTAGLGLPCSQPHSLTPSLPLPSETSPGPASRPHDGPMVHSLQELQEVPASAPPALPQHPQPLGDRSRRLVALCWESLALLGRRAIRRPCPTLPSLPPSHRSPPKAFPGIQLWGRQRAWLLPWRLTL